MTNKYVLCIFLFGSLQTLGATQLRIYSNFAMKIAIGAPPAKPSSLFGALGISSPSFFSTLSDEAEALIAKNEFAKKRGLQEYISTFGDPFRWHMSRLSSSDHVIDLGAGECVFAKEISEKCQVTAIAYTSSAKNHGNLKVLKGDFFENLDLESVRQADIIVDLFGVHAYTHDFSLTFARTMELLKVGGSLYLSGHSRTRFLLDGLSRSLTEWLKRIDGIQVTRLDGDGLLIRKSHEEILVPILKLAKIEGNYPPEREFHEPCPWTFVE